MSRIYGHEQREARKKICEDLIEQLNQLYLQTFEEITKVGFGDGVLANLTQLLLKSRDQAITPLEDDMN